MKIAAKFFIVSLFQFQAIGQFSGDFDPGNWTLNTTYLGDVLTSNAPDSIRIFGPNSGGNHTLDYSIPIISSMGCPGTTISFDWRTIHSDCAFDSLYYGVNGIYTFISMCSGTGNSGQIDLLPGDIFSFHVVSYNAHPLMVSFTISNFIHVDSDTINVYGNVTPTLSGNDGEIDLNVSGGAPPYIFNWSNGANTEDLIGLSVGTYSVTVIDANGCEALHTFEVTSQLGLTETIDDANIFPNPAEHTITISCQPNDLILIMNSNGNLVESMLSNGVNFIDISKLSPGIYSINIIGESNTTRTKLIKQ